MSLKSSDLGMDIMNEFLRLNKEWKAENKGKHNKKLIPLNTIIYPSTSKKEFSRY